MRKFLAVVKHEYKKIVLKWSFILATLMFPILAAAFAVVPALLFSIKGEPTRLVIVDQTGKVAPRLRENLSKEKEAATAPSQDEVMKDLTNSSQQEQMKRAAGRAGETFNVVEYRTEEKSIEQIRRELNGKITGKEIDAYLIVPPNYDAADAQFEFFSRKAGDFVANSSLKNAINGAVRSQRLADANISEDRLKNLSQNINLSVKKVSETGDEKDGEGSFAAAFVVGLMIYITLLIYGQQILAAVIEEKETRIAEILFSSAKPFELMMGKLVGVGLAGLTQLAIWILSALILLGVGVAQMSAAGMNISIPDITPLTVVYFFVFFSAGLFHIRDNLRADRFDGNDDAGRQPVCDDSGLYSGHWVLYELYGYPRPEFEPRLLGFNRAVSRADYNARPHSGGNAAVLANRAFDFS
jgi:ABC-2 type transport system permease protein